MKGLASFLMDFVRDVGSVTAVLETGDCFLYFEARKFSNIVVRFVYTDGDYTLEVDYPGIGVVRVYYNESADHEFKVLVRDFILALMKASDLSRDDIERFKKFISGVGRSSDSKPFFLRGVPSRPATYNSDEEVSIAWGRP